MDPNVVTQVTSSNFVRRFTFFFCFFFFFSPSHLHNKTDNIFVLFITELRMHHLSNKWLEAFDITCSRHTVIKTERNNTRRDASGRGKTRVAWVELSQYATRPKLPSSFSFIILHPPFILYSPFIIAHRFTYLRYFIWGIFMAVLEYCWNSRDWL